MHSFGVASVVEKLRATGGGYEVVHDSPGLGLLDEQIDEPEDGKQGVGQVVADVGRELAEGSGAGGRDELALDSRATLIREGQ